MRQLRQVPTQSPSCTRRPKRRARGPRARGAVRARPPQSSSRAKPGVAARNAPRRRHSRLSRCCQVPVRPASREWIITAGIERWLPEGGGANPPLRLPKPCRSSRGVGHWAERSPHECRHARAEVTPETRSAPGVQTLPLLPGKAPGRRQVGTGSGDGASRDRTGDLRLANSVRRESGWVVIRQRRAVEPSGSVRHDSGGRRSSA